MVTVAKVFYLNLDKIRQITGDLEADKRTLARNLARITKMHPDEAWAHVALKADRPFGAYAFIVHPDANASDISLARGIFANLGAIVTPQGVLDTPCHQTTEP